MFVTVWSSEVHSSGVVALQLLASRLSLDVMTGQLCAATDFDTCCSRRCRSVCSLGRGAQLDQCQESGNTSGHALLLPIVGRQTCERKQYMPALRVVLHTHFAVAARSAVSSLLVTSAGEERPWLWHRSRMPRSTVRVSRWPGEKAMNSLRCDGLEFCPLHHPFLKCLHRSSGTRLEHPPMVAGK